MVPISYQWPRCHINGPDVISMAPIIISMAPIIISMAPTQRDGVAWRLDFIYWYVLMVGECQFHLLTFATKYSRIPKEGIALRRYNAAMETWREPLVLDISKFWLLWDAFNEQAQKLWIKIIAGNIIPDHVHLVIDRNEKSIPGIAQKLKGYSARLYNKALQRSGPVWAVGYSDTYLDNERHLENAIEYVSNNHIKHQEKRWPDQYYSWWESL